MIFTHFIYKFIKIGAKRYDMSLRCFEFVILLEHHGILNEI